MLSPREKEEEDKESSDTRGKGGDARAGQAQLRGTEVSIYQDIITTDVQDVCPQHNPHRRERVGRPVAKLLERIEKHGEDDREKLQDIIRYDVGIQLARLPQHIEVEQKNQHDETQQDTEAEVDAEAVLQHPANLAIFLLRKEIPDDRRQAVGKTHAEDKGQVKEVIDERSRRQFLGAVMPHHDVVSKANDDDTQLAQHDGDAEADGFFDMRHAHALSTFNITIFSVGRSCLFVLEPSIFSTTSMPSTTSP